MSIWGYVIQSISVALDNYLKGKVKSGFGGCGLCVHLCVCACVFMCVSQEVFLNYFPFLFFETGSPAELGAHCLAKLAMQ